MCPPSPPTPPPTFSFKAKLVHLKINLIILLLGHKCSRIHLQFTIEYTHTNSISRNACGLFMLMLNPPIHIRIQIHWIARHVRRKLCSCCIRIQIHCIARHVRRKLCSCCFGWEALRPCFYFEPCHRSVYSMSKRAHSLRCQGSRGRDID